MYYQGLPSLIVPSQMMICGTMTLPYLFRIHLFGVGAKVEDSIISGLVTRQGGCHISSALTYPIKLSRVLAVFVQKAGGEWAFVSRVQSISTTRLAWDYTDQNNNIRQYTSSVFIVGV